jgi:hypothetical protein
MIPAEDRTSKTSDRRSRLDERRKGRDLAATQATDPPVRTDDGTRHRP